MEENIFRKKNLDQLNSPEQLNDYLKVASPELWMVLLGILFLLLGVIAWGYFGRIGGGLIRNCLVVSGEGAPVCYIASEDLGVLEGDSALMVKVYRLGENAPLASMEGSVPVMVEGKDLDELTQRLLAGAGYDPAGQMGTITLEGLTLTEGLYLADIEQKGIKPLSLLF